MTSYAHKGIRVFNEKDPDFEVLRNRSEGRLKKYQSACDVRAWCDDVEDRRQFFLENAEKDIQGTKQKVPLAALFHGGPPIALGEEGDEINELQAEIEYLQKQLDAFRQVKLTSEQEEEVQTKIRQQGLDLDSELD